MQLALPYTLAPLPIPVDQYNIIYNDETTAEHLFDFLASYPDKRINVLFKNTIPADTVLSIANKVHPQFHVHVRPTLNPQSFITKLSSLGIKYYLDTPVSSWTQLHQFVSLGVSDIYIGGDLFHELPEARAICTENNISTRIILNKIPSTDLPADPCSAFFVPQDYDTIDKYFDTGEFFDPFDAVNCDSRAIKTLFKTWYDKKKWIGSLQEINQDIAFSLPCASYDPSFTLKKITCGGRCLRGRPCNHCASTVHMLNSLAEKGVKIVNT